MTFSWESTSANWIVSERVSVLLVLYYAIVVVGVLMCDRLQINVRKRS